MRASEFRYKGLFEDSPIALWEEDFSVIKHRLDALREDGITDFREYFTLHPEAVVEYTALVKVLDINKATMRMFGAEQKDDIFKGLKEILGGELNRGFKNELINITDGKLSFGWEASNNTLDGRLININLNWSAVPGYEKSLSKVIVSMIDITERKQAEEALRESEARYRGLFEDSPISLWEEDFSPVKERLDALRAAGITDFQEYFILHPEEVTKCAPLIKVVDVNKTTVSLFGADRKEDIIKSPAEIFEGEPIHVLRNELINIAAGKTRFDWEGINKTLDGRLVNMDLSWSVAPGYENSLSKVIVSVIDITERKHAEEALRTSETRFRGLFEDSPISLWEEDYSALKEQLDALRAAGITDFREYFNSHPAVVTECAALIKVLDVNKATLKMFGADRKEDIIKNATDLIMIEQTEVYQYEFIKIAEGKTQFSWEGKNKMVDGRLIDIIMNWSVAPGYEKTLSKVIVSIIDTTERKRAEAALAKSAQAYRALFENMPIGLYRTSADGRLLDANLALVKMFGYKDREALLAVNIENLYVDPASDRKFKSEIVKTGIVSNFEAEVKRPDGSTFWTEDHNHVISDEEGTPLFYEGSLIDITERRLAEEKIRRQLEQLAALRSIDQMITSSFDLQISLTMILNQVKIELGVDAAKILLLNNANLFLECSTWVGFRTKAAEKVSVRLGQEYAGRVALERKLIHIPNLNDQPDDPIKTNLAGENFVCYMGVPLVAKGFVKGVLEVYHRSPLEPDQEWLDFLNTLAGQAAIAIDNANLFDNLQRSNIDLTLAYDDTIEGWSRAMDLRDKETEGHTLRVTEMTMELAGLFGIMDEDLVSIRRGTLLHDIGKMGVPDAILLKPAALTDEEWVVMTKHPVFAFEMLSSIRYLRSAIDIPYCHHEKWDGTGYPRGLKGELIPLPARIFAIVDVWDALTSDRPYRKAWSKEKAIEYIRSQAGTHFDPKIVQICLESGVFERKKQN